MDKLTYHRQAVRRLVEQYSSEKPSHGEIASYPVIDPVGDHYLAVQAGWDGHRRIQGAFLHIDIIGETVWIQFNGTDRRVASELVAAGVPKGDIVLGEKPVEVRQYTGYAVG